MEKQLTYWLMNGRIWLIATTSNDGACMCFTNLDEAVDFQRQNEEMMAGLYEIGRRLSGVMGAGDRSGS